MAQTTIRVYFTGMCLAAWHGSDPARTNRMDVLMHNGAGENGSGHRHRPFVAISADSIEPGNGVDATVSVRVPAVTDFGILDISEFDCRLDSNAKTPEGVEITRGDVNPAGSKDPNAWKSAEWISDPAKASGQALKVDPRALPTHIGHRHAGVAATFLLTRGQFGAAIPAPEQQHRSFTFYAKPQPFADTFVVEWSGDVETLAIVGTSFGERPNRNFRVGLRTQGTVELFVSNLPGLRLAQFDRTDFDPFYDLFVPRLQGVNRPAHLPESTAGELYCMAAIGQV
jgi:hypothetical protein